MAEDAVAAADAKEAGASAAAGSPDAGPAAPAPPSQAAPAAEAAPAARSWRPTWRGALAFAAPAPPAAARTEPALAVLPEAGATSDATPARAPSSLFGGLDADERLRQTHERNERTLWTGALGATLVYAFLIAAQTVGGFAVPVPLEERQKERRGQDGVDTINVELVPDPDKTAKTRRWQEGTEMPAPQPMEQMPQPPQPPQQEQREQQETAEAVPEEPQANAPPLLDLESLVDAAAADFSRQVERAFQKPQKRQEERQPVYSAGAMKVRGQGAAGKSDEFTRSVIAALMKTRPGPFAIWGRVLVSFELSPGGTLNYVRVLHSSGNSALDQAAVNAIHKARFQVPPPGLSRQERTYIIDYIFG